MSVSFARTLSGRSVPRVGTERPRRPNWRKVKGFLMDIDGTMAETDPLHEIAIREMFRRAGASADVVVDHRFIRENISGVDNADIVEKFLPHLSPEDAEKWIVDKESYFREVAKTQIEPVQGLRELMRWIKRRGIAAAAVTNAPRPNALMILEGIGLAADFAPVVIGPECSNAKPHPEPYLAAMRKLGLQPEDCVAVEDSVTGAMAAVAAGVYTIGILTSQTAEAMGKIGVSHTIRDYRDLLREIEA